MNANAQKTATYRRPLMLGRATAEERAEAVVVSNARLAAYQADPSVENLRACVAVEPPEAPAVTTPDAELTYNLYQILEPAAPGKVAYKATGAVYGVVVGADGNEDNSLLFSVTQGGTVTRPMPGARCYLTTVRAYGSPVYAAQVAAIEAAIKAATGRRVEKISCAVPDYPKLSDEEIEASRRRMEDRLAKATRRCEKRFGFAPKRVSA